MSPEAVSSTESSPERAYEQIWRISRSDGEISESEVIHEELYS